MKMLLVLFLMLFLHCFADFHLQGILSNLKQRDWWISETGLSRSKFNASQYRYDYRVALIIHGFEWSCVVCAPIFMTAWHHFYNVSMTGVCLFLISANGFIHAAIDDVKANGTNSLLSDQFIHLIQLVTIWGTWTVIFGW